MRMRVVVAVLVIVGVGILLAGCGKGTAPSISAHPRGQTTCAGGSVTFSVTATGTAPLSYQWKKDGTAIPGATGPSYTIASVALTHAGSYTVTVTNAAGNVTSNAALLTVNAAPAVTAHPTSQTICEGSPATLAVAATGTAPLSYQWKVDGSDIAGATSPSYTIAAASPAHAGSYTVAITNACGTVTSNAATLTVSTSPSITSHPISQEVPADAPVTFSVTATGSSPLTYQWKVDGSDIAGATSPSYTIAAASPAHAGSYTAVVANPCGTVTSDPATLAVTAPPEPTPTEPAPPEPTATPEPAAPTVIATVNGHPLSRQAFEDIKLSILSYYARLYAQFGIDIRIFLVGARGRMFELELELNALSNLLTRGIVESEAARRGLVISPEEIEAEFERQYQAMLDAYGITEDYLIGYFAAQGGTLDEFKEEGRRSVAEQLLHEAVQRAVAGPIELSEDDLRRYFEDHRGDYSTAEEVKASHILVATAEEAQAILDELAAGAEFAELARSRSSCPSASQGGDLGWFGRGMMVREFEEAAFALEVGETSGIVESQFGFHIIRLTDRRAAFQPEFAEVAERVRTDATAEVASQRFDEWLKRARQEATIVITDPILHAMYMKGKDLDQGIAAFERIREEGQVQEKYLSFIIGSLYEEKMAELESEKELVESKFPEGPEREAQIAAIDEAIERARQSALAAYRRALTELPGDEDVLERIAALEATGPLPR